MSGSRSYPEYVSAESHTFEPVIALYEIGYRRFKFINQKILNNFINVMPNPPREGKYVENPEWHNASGPFGTETPDGWLGIKEAAIVFDCIERLKPLYGILGGTWFDCHAARN
jgi:hypothetical protein